MTQNRPKKWGKTIRIGLATAERLDDAKHQGQSYDGIIAELLDTYETGKGTDSSGKQEKGRK